MESRIRAVDLYKSYRSDTSKLKVLKGLSLSVERGEIVAILWASGAGKSTLLHILGALDRPSSGEIYFNGEKIFDLDDKSLSTFRNRKIGFVFQFHYLLPEFSALENVMMPALIKREKIGGVKKKAVSFLEEVGLGERFKERPAKLSGGEQQRVAVARSLINEPDLILADEPTGNLDTDTGRKVFELIEGLVKEKGVSLVFATHNEGLAKSADRVFRLIEGRLVFVAKKEKVLDKNYSGGLLWLKYRSCAIFDG